MSIVLCGESILCNDLLKNIKHLNQLLFGLSDDIVSKWINSHGMKKIDKKKNVAFQNLKLLFFKLMRFYDRYDQSIYFFNDELY